MVGFRCVLLLCLLSVALCTAQDLNSKPANETSDPVPAEEPTDDGGQAEVNLLGRTDTSSGEGRRNENVQFNAIDNNALKDSNIRLGTTATIVEEFRADQDYFSAEFGNPPSAQPHLKGIQSSGVHGKLNYSHNNSLFSARSFFQVGDVKPSRENSYGFSIGLPVWKGALLSLEGSQNKIRGNVNGNVLVPTAEERTSLATDPYVRSVIEKFLSAYPDELPNRTDINPRALNTNSINRIDDNSGGMRLDQNIGQKNRLILQHQYTSQKVDAFQLVAGQNPDTTTRVHIARITWNREWSPSTVTDFTTSFNRVGSLLMPEENAAETMVGMGRAIEKLGPDYSIPIDRAENLFRYAGAIHQIGSVHSWYAGFDVTRRQLNGFESDSHRGMLSFSSGDFDGDGVQEDAITNLLLGRPTRFTGSVGNVHRGFRNWDMSYFIGDEWGVNSSLTLSFGLRYEPMKRPTEVNKLNVFPYGNDLNNLAPRFGFAYQLPGNWGILRGAYGLHYGQIYPVTFGQIRYNAPLNNPFQIFNPDLTIPLSELLESGADPDTIKSKTEISPDLATPYSHQYNLSWKVLTATHWNLELGYVGSRSHKLLSSWNLNRARVVEGIEQTTSTIQQRRPNQEYSEIRLILNGSRAYYDAGRATFTVTRWQGISLEASYWFSKAIDLGNSYSDTAAGRDAMLSRSQSEFEVHDEMKGLSSFDQPHSFLLRADYQLPALPGSRNWMNRIFAGWTVSTVALVKSGTPFTVATGSDAPGFGNVDGVTGERPNVVDPSVLGRTIGNPATSAELLPREAFAYIEPTDLRGNLGANTFRKGKIANVNAMLARSFSVGGDRLLSFRAESINFFNTPQFAAPGFRLTARISATLPTRSMTAVLSDSRWSCSSSLAALPFWECVSGMRHYSRKYLVRL